MDKVRMNYFDNAKGILIILMVVGHIFLYDVLPGFVYWIYTFHMPAFFIINGMLFHHSKALERPFSKTLLNYIYTIMIPFVFSEAVGAFHYIVRFGFTQSIFGFAYNTLRWHFNNGPDWFLVVLFVSDILFVSLNKLVKDKRIQIVTCTIVACACLFALKEWSIVKLILTGFSCVCLGYYLFPFFAKLENIIVAGLCLAATLVVLVTNGSVNMNGLNLNNPVLWILGAICGTYLVLYAGKRINLTPLTYIGRNSLIVMITHQAIIIPIRHYTGLAKFSLIQGIIVLIITIALQFPLCYLLNRFLPFLIGRKFPKNS